jgi:hypothetical protein
MDSIDNELAALELQWAAILARREMLLERKKTQLDFIKQHESILVEPDGWFNLLPDETLIGILLWVDIGCIMRPLCRRFYALRKPVLKIIARPTITKLGIGKAVKHSMLKNLCVWPVCFYYHMITMSDKYSEFKSTTCAYIRKRNTVDDPYKYLFRFDGAFMEIHKIKVNNSSTRLMIMKNGNCVEVSIANYSILVSDNHDVILCDKITRMPVVVNNGAINKINKKIYSKFKLL